MLKQRTNKDEGATKAKGVGGSQRQWGGREGGAIRVIGRRTFPSGRAAAPPATCAPRQGHQSTSVYIGRRAWRCRVQAPTAVRAPLPRAGKPWKHRHIPKATTGAASPSSVRHWVVACVDLSAVHAPSETGGLRVVTDGFSCNRFSVAGHDCVF